MLARLSRATISAALFDMNGAIDRCGSCVLDEVGACPYEPFAKVIIVH